MANDFIFIDNTHHFSKTHQDKEYSVFYNKLKLKVVN